MTFNEILENITAVIKGTSLVKHQALKMGVVLQEKIDAEYAGVLFSSDPLTYRKDQMVLTYTAGLGDKLVSGELEGKDVIISVKDEGYGFDADLDDKTKELIKKLAIESKLLEKKLDYPIDIEWAIAKGNLYFLQCRPLTSITSVQTQMIKVNDENLKKIPAQLVSHDKIKLRLVAEKKNIMISDAYAYIKNTCCSKRVKIELPTSDFCRGHSAVIIYPPRVSDKVIRSFVGEKMRLFGEVTGCCRYGIRSYPDFENLETCMDNFTQKIEDNYWISTTIIQEIYDPIYTGVVQHISEGYLIEITKGHFLTKGVVPTSQYIVSESGVVIDRKEIHQEEWLKIIEGHIIFCTCNDDNETLVTLNDESLRSIVNCFAKILMNDSNVVEFGVLHEEGKLTPYLIDFVDDNSPITISAEDIKNGIVSFGKISGKPVFIQDKGKDSLNEHFHNTESETEKSDEQIVFICNNPELSLLKLIEKHKPENIGFVFRNCAMGAHLAVVLREKRIPAIKMDEPIGVILEDCICYIDAQTPGLPPNERIRIE